MTPSAAFTYTPEGSHYYHRDGKPCYEVPCKSRPGEFRKTTVKDARKLGLLPSVTTILKVLASFAIEAHRIEQAVLAVMTSPRFADESDDAFVYRILHVEEQQRKEVEAAADKGTAIHEAIGLALAGKSNTSDLTIFVNPVLAWVDSFSGMISYSCEQTIVGGGYAGRVDLEMIFDDHVKVPDFKTCKELPDDSYVEHKLQGAAYCKPISLRHGLPCRNYNIYISKAQPGQIKVIENLDWENTYEAFASLVNFWYWANKLNRVGTPIATLS